MRLKSELYAKQQDETIDKIINILDLQNITSYTLYDFDNNVDIQNKIMELIPEIRKWFSFNGMKAVRAVVGCGIETVTVHRISTR